MSFLHDNDLASREDRKNQLLLTNARYIDWQTLSITRSHLLVGMGGEGGIRLTNEVPADFSGKLIDCSGKYVTHSFAIGHHHTYSAMAKGMPAPAKNPVNFHEVLQYIWWNLDECLNDEMIEYSALVTAMAAAKAGSGFVIDHHASPSAIGKSLERMAKAFDRVGLSHLLCYELTDRNGTQGGLEGIRETESYLTDHQGLVGLHASFTVGDELLEKAVALSAKLNTGLHVHVAEDQFDQQHCSEKHQCSVVERLQKAGVLNSSKTLLVHALHLSDHERDLIRQSPAWVVQNAESNMNNRVGFFSAKRLGDRILLGTDGMHSDMLQSAKMAFFASQHYDPIGYDETYRRFRNVHHYLQQNDFTGDASNNLVILDYDTATELTTQNFLGHFIFGLRAEHVQSLIVKGRLVMHNRKILNLDEQAVLTESRKLATTLWEKMKKNR